MAGETGQRASGNQSDSPLLLLVRLRPILSSHWLTWLCLKDNGHLQNWGKLPCHGKQRHGVCVWSLLDLASILKDKNNYIINKFRSDFDPFVFECIRDNIRQREALE